MYAHMRRTRLGIHICTPVPFSPCMCARESSKFIIFFSIPFLLDISIHCSIIRSVLPITQLKGIVMSPAEFFTDVEKKHLRKVKGVAGKLQDVARNSLVSGNTEQGAYIQFGADLRIYNLYEALLYAHNYEESGAYAAGTVEKTCHLVRSSL